MEAENMSVNDVITIDCLYERPRHAAAYLIIENGEAVFVETNTVHAVPILLGALKQNGLTPEQVRHVIITHIHFDHAGGTSVLLDHCPNADVICHPRAQRHLVDPSRLIESATQVYGAEEFERLYMPMHEIAESRVRSVDDHAQMTFGGRTFTFAHTRGHANHHMVIHDSKTGSVFTGDAFGVEYDSERRSDLPFLLCSSAPTDFDPDEALASVDKILALHPSRLYLTHYGELTHAEVAAAVLKESITQLAGIAEAAVDLSLHGEELQAYCAEGVLRAAEGLAGECGFTLSRADYDALDWYTGINSQGLAIYAEKCMTAGTA
jgi:glyoxylase-like metal-dependent hydrolase (beta-lactamase superfamily II)